MPISTLEVFNFFLLVMLASAYIASIVALGRVHDRDMKAMMKVFDQLTDEIFKDREALGNLAKTLDTSALTRRLEEIDEHIKEQKNG